MARPLNLQERLEHLKETIEGAQERKSRLEGERDSILKRLKEEFGCESLKEAEKLLAALEGRES